MREEYGKILTVDLYSLEDISLNVMIDDDFVLPFGNPEGKRGVRDFKVSSIGKTTTSAAEK
jgi:hypothetical protein